MKIAIIGYGGMGNNHRKYIIPRLNDSDYPEKLEIAGIYDISEERKEFAAQLGLHNFDSAEQIFADESIKIVLIATPNDLHKPYALEAMSRGKNVIVEKPMGMNTEEVNQMYAAAEKYGKVFTVHQNRRFDDDFNVVRKILRENIIGRPYFINSRLFGEKGLPGDWRSCKEAGGGMLYDWSVHLIDQILYLFDDTPHTVYAELKRVFFPEVDDCNRVNLIFDSGINVQIVVDTWCYQSEARWHIGGNDGTAAIYGWPEYTGEIVKALDE